MGEARGKTFRHEIALHRAQESCVALRGAEALQLEELPCPIGERDFARFPVEVSYEEAGFFDLDLTPEAPELDHILVLSREEADAAIEGRTQSEMLNRLAVMSPAAVVVEAETERAQRRRPGAHSFATVSDSALPSGFTRKAPR